MLVGAGGQPKRSAELMGEGVGTEVCFVSELRSTASS